MIQWHDNEEMIASSASPVRSPDSKGRVTDHDPRRATGRGHSRISAVQRNDGPACGCDRQPAQDALVSMDEAFRRIAEHLTPLQDDEQVSFLDARGRVLAKPISAQADMPRFDHAAMDGYALCSATLKGRGPWRLPVKLRCAAGEDCPGALSAGSAARIFTGAPIPPGADCVIMQEEVERQPECILVSRKPKPRENMRLRGEECLQGTDIVAAGTRVTSRSIAAAASSGCGFLAVRRRVRVSLLVTGTEVARPGSADMGSAQIWDVNTPMLQSILTRPGVEMVGIEALPDCVEGIRDAMARQVGRSDLVITTGGVSVGEEDHLPAAVRAAGGFMHFKGVAIKPGKPVTFGRIGGAAWFGLPGNPQSAFVAWTLFGEAILARLSGLTRPDGRSRQVVLGHPVRRKPGRCEIRVAGLLGRDGMGRDLIDCRNPVNSGQVGALGAADGLAILPAGADYLPEGALIEFLPFSPN